MTIFDDVMRQFEEHSLAATSASLSASWPRQNLHVPICIIYDVEDEQIKRARVILNSRS